MDITAGYGDGKLQLAIVSRILDNLGGAMTIESELGKGSTFSFTFPAKVVKE